MPTYGRLQHHDPRSRSFPHATLPTAALRSAAWTRRTPILDQGQRSSCTGNAGTGWLATDSAGRTATPTVTISRTGAAASHGRFTAGVHRLDETFAISLYSLATVLDGLPGAYPPQDDGSCGLGIAKALKALGLASAYRHAFSEQSLATALQIGPVIIGVPWIVSMETPRADGRIPVDPASGVAGGHEVEVAAFDVEGGWYWITNSWGASWGVGGRGYITRTDMAWLLKQGGDVTVPIRTSAYPVPAPRGPLARIRARLCGREA